jgi:hypothetical protein
VGDEPDWESGSESASDLAGDPLWERLRALRSEWARELKQPAYCIFTNQTLEALVRDRPTTPAALASIKGLGRSRIERHGAALLEAIAAHPHAASPLTPSMSEAKPPASEAPAQAVPPRPASTSSPSKHVSTEEWTWRLVDRGFSIDEAAAIRGLEPTAIIRHLTWMVRRGHPLAVGSFLSPEVASAWDSWRAAQGDANPPAEPADKLLLWPLFLACRTGRS